MGRPGEGKTCHGQRPVLRRCRLRPPLRGRPVEEEHAVPPQGSLRLFAKLLYAWPPVSYMSRLMKLRPRTATTYPSLELSRLVFGGHSSFLCLALSCKPQFFDLLGLCGGFPLLSDASFGCCVGLLPLSSCLCKRPLVLHPTRSLAVLLLFECSDRDKPPRGYTGASLPEYARAP